MNTKELVYKIQNGGLDERLLDIYMDEKELDVQKERYVKAVKTFETHYGCTDVVLFSAPGRSEVGGNHTDHQHGRVLATSIHLDTLGVTTITTDNRIRVISEGYEEISISLEDLSVKSEEKETTTALIKGVAAGFLKKKYTIGGFSAYITSEVLIGSGLSSSAAFETLIGTILSGLYNDMAVSPTEIAMIGKYAENVYFGKPSGLMDQMACSVGNLVYIDFKEPENPKVEKINVDLGAFGYSLCITDTKGSHADLTYEYAAVPEEMKLVAKHFGKDVLREVAQEELVREIPKIRETLGDRFVLRALHFMNENARVAQEVEALKMGQVERFLKLVKESGDSSFKYLQNIYSVNDVQDQNMSVALLISDMALRDNGVSRVHGGGFAGTIQAFVRKEHVSEYKKQMDSVFGKDACKELKIRKYGGIKVIL